MNIEWYEKVRRALEKSWSDKTSFCYDPSIAPPSYGQCAQTAVVIFENFGGEILVTDNTPNMSGRHFYNRINGTRYDFTADQFDISIEYRDILSSKEEAASETFGNQLSEMRRAFLHAWNEQATS